MHLLKTVTLLLATLFTAAAPATAQIDRESSVVVDYQHLRHASIAEIQTWTSQGYRLSNFEIANPPPALTLNCSLVRNTGVYSASWLFYYDKTRTELWNLVGQHNARIVDLERYDDAGQEKFAALLFVNTGAQAKSWHCFFDVPQGSVYSTVNGVGDRIIDLEPVTVNGQQRYHVVSIANSGADYKDWWVYTNTSAAAMQNHVAQYGSRIYDFELENLIPGTTCCVLVRDNIKSLTLWGQYYGVGYDEDTQNGGRIVGLGKQGITGYVVTMLDNMNPFTATGIGCAGTNGPTLHNALGSAFTGGQVTYRVSNLRPWAPAFICYGLTSQTMSLAPLGAPGCWGYVNPIATELRFANGNGVAADTLALPPNPGLAGLPLLTQMLALDPGINSLGVVASNRLRTMVRHW
jgi:hypothetical protein